MQHLQLEIITAFWKPANIPLMDFRRFSIDMLIENHRFERESTESETLQSAPLNFWKMEGAQKATFSVLNLSSQMHFRSQLWPGGHFGGILSFPEMQIWMRHAGEIDS